MGPASLIVLTIAAIVFAGGGIAAARFLVKGTKNPVKGQAYECGIPSEGSPWNQFNIGYYLFALIFLIFDVELVCFAHNGRAVSRDAPVIQLQVITGLRAAPDQKGSLRDAHIFFCTVIRENFKNRFGADD